MAVEIIPAAIFVLFWQNAGHVKLVS